MLVTRELVLQNLEAESREQRHLQEVHGYIELDEVTGKDGVGIVQLGQVEKSADTQTQRRYNMTRIIWGWPTLALKYLWSENNL